jgi:site-specific DNA-methyltransferase (adenine-specific)
MSKIGEENEAGEYVRTKGQSQWEGWGTALKPANEPICVARKPLSEKTIAENVLKWGTGGINIDGCRIEGAYGTGQNEVIEGKEAGQMYHRHENGMEGNNYKQKIMVSNPEGRFPANIILECLCDEVIKGEKGERTTKETNINNKEANWFRNAGGDKEDRWSFNDKGDIHTNPMCPCRLMDEQTGYLKSGEVKPHHKKNKTANGYQGSCYGKFQNEDTTLKGYGDGGGASRFFYQAKVSKAERNMGLEGFETKITPNSLGALGRKSLEDRLEDKSNPIISKNNHPTIKPVSLMAYLCRLVTPVGGIVLDPFMGSGSTGIAAQLEGFKFCGMEMDEDYFKIASARIENFEKYRKFIQPDQKLKNGNTRMASRGNDSNSLGLGICKK